MPIIDYSISIGNLLTIVTVIASTLGFVYNMKGDIKLVQNDLGHLEESQKALAEAFTQLGRILTAVAVQDTRIGMVEKKMDELAHGQGFVGRRVKN